MPGKLFQIHLLCALSEYAEVEEPDEDVTSSDHHLLTELRESLEQIATQEGGTQLSTILTEGGGQMHLETMSSFTVCTAPVPVLPNLRPSLSQADNYGPLSMTRGELQSVEIAAPLTTESDVAAKEDGIEFDSLLQRDFLKFLYLNSYDRGR